MSVSWLESVKDELIAKFKIAQSFMNALLKENRNLMAILSM